MNYQAINIKKIYQPIIVVDFICEVDPQPAILEAIKLPSRVAIFNLFCNLRFVIFISFSFMMREPVPSKDTGHKYNIQH